jgi:hypothetical protein
MTLQPSSKIPESQSRDRMMRAIETNLGLRGKFPSVRQLMKMADITGIHEIQHHLLMLEKYGYLTKVQKRGYNRNTWQLTKKRYFEE